MQAFSLQDIPNEYKEIKDQITNSVMKKIYEQFTFFYFPYFLTHFDDNNKNLINDFLIDFLKKHKLITYGISKCKYNSNDADSDCIITVEGKCIIIEKANVPFMNDIFVKISSTIINVNSSFLDELVTNFCKNFQKEKKNNFLIALTLHSISGYLIGRFFYPTCFFKDPSFFKFDPNNCIEDEIRLKLTEALKTDKKEVTKKLINEINEKIVTEDDEYQTPKIYEFTKEDFITLQTIGKSNSSNSFFYLVIHRESLFLFVIKILSNNTNIQHESYFCENFRHHCITRFYGYMRNKEKINGLVYEFMSNGTLNDYIINNDATEIYLQLTLLRIFQGIKFLQSHSLIHRDLKPLNILLDHDYLPYISDLETIRQLTKDNTDFTIDFASPIYSSPEQYMGECSLISFSSDIYSFGAIVYFVFEKKNMFGKNQSIISFLQKEDIPTLKRASTNFQYIYKSCVKYNPKERLTIKQIERILMKEVNSFNYLEKYLFQEWTEEITQYLTESILLLTNHQRFLLKYLRFINNFHKTYSIRNEKNSSSFYYYLGKIFYNGVCFVPDYSKSKYYFELSAKENNCNAILMLGDLYYKGRGVKKDYVKAKEYYELATKSNCSKAFLNIGDLYFNGKGVEQDYLKAKEYYELSAQLNNSKALLKIGDIYFNGKGVEQNYSKAKEYYELSAHFNNSDALFNLGYMLKKGLGIELNIDKAMEYYEQSARLNNPKAFIIIGFSFLYDLQVNNLNYKNVKKYLLLAAQQDYPQAFFGLGLLYERGKGVKQDFIKAKKYYEKAAKSNHTDALTNLGLLYLKGNGIIRDIHKAKYYLELAAKQNGPIAAYFLGVLYTDDEVVEYQDFKKAKEYYELSAKLNYSRGIYALGTFYSKGLGVEKDPLKAVELFYEFSKNDFSVFIDLNDYYDLKDMAQLINALISSHDYLCLGDRYKVGRGVEQNFSKALKYYEISAKLNNPQALYYLGLIYFEGITVKKDYIKAKHYFDLAVHFGDSNSFNYLGLLYLNGYSIGKDLQKAKEYFEIACGMNNLDSFINLGNMYFFGNGVKQNYEKAKYYFEFAAQKNDPLALYNLGRVYLMDDFKDHDYSKGIQYFEQSAIQGYSEAFTALGYIYFEGKNVQQNLTKAAQYMELGAMQGNMNAFLNLGNFYFMGIGVEQNYLKAKEYYEYYVSKSDQVNIIAFINLGMIYLNGLCGKYDFSKSKQYFEIGAKQNHPAAFNNLGLIYYYGYGTPKDYLKAKYYFELAVKQGITEAYANLATMYFNGTGVEKNCSKAIEYYELSAKHNNSFALLILGSIYYTGQNIQKDYLKAHNYFYKSAILGDSVAMCLLGDIYLTGKGVKKDILKARCYYELSSHKGNLQAFFRLGNLYSNGEFFDIDIKKSIKFFKKSINMQKDVYKTARYNNDVVLLSSSNNLIKYCCSNNLGLIYIIFYQDINKAVKYIKESAFAEYAFGQNNYGLINQFYLDKIEEAQHYFERASKQKFALAEYNLGFIHDKKGQHEQAIDNYIKASEYEEEDLMFHEEKIEDTQFQISKLFIICLANFKLARYYYKKSCIDIMKNYFVTIISTLNQKGEELQYKFLFNYSNNDENLFLYIKKFILNFPLFNLKDNYHNMVDFDQNNNLTNDNNNSQSETNFIKNNNECDFDKKMNLEYNDTAKKDIVFDNPGFLFDFALKNNKREMIFIKCISDIISIMESILYTPPYRILFGRIDISKIKQIDKRKNINELFYEGFEYKI